MKFKHTSGKWKVRKTVDNSGDYPVPTYDIIAIHEWGPEGVADVYQNPFNANLIAAAPDMLEAMIHMIKLGYTCDAMTGAIERATGLNIQQIMEEEDNV